MKTLIAITEDDEGYEDISLDLRGCNLIDIVGSIGEIIHQVADMYEERGSCLGKGQAIMNWDELLSRFGDAVKGDCIKGVSWGEYAPPTAECAGGDFYLRFHLRDGVEVVVRSLWMDVKVRLSRDETQGLPGVARLN